MERGVIRKITLIINFWLNIYYWWQPVARSPHARNPHARSPQPACPHARKIAIPDSPDELWKQLESLQTWSDKCRLSVTIQHNALFFT